jgi:uncharacterized protein (TIGR02246 family)
MRTSMILLTVAALAVCLGVTALSQDTAADEEAIEQLAVQYTEGWKNSDAKTCAAVYAPDADTIDFTGQVAKGREEIEKSIAEDLTTFEGTEIKLQRTGIRFVKPDLAVWDGTWEVTGVPEAAAQQMPSKGLSTAVAVKQDGQWLIAKGITSVPPPPVDSGQ